MLVDKVAEAISDRTNLYQQIVHKDTYAARAAIEVVLREMYAGRSINLSGTDYTERWRDTIKCFADREGIDLGD